MHIYLQSCCWYSMSHMIGNTWMVGSAFVFQCLCFIHSKRKVVVEHSLKMLLTSDRDGFVHTRDAGGIKKAEFGMGGIAKICYLPRMEKFILRNLFRDSFWEIYSEIYSEKFISMLSTTMWMSLRTTSMHGGGIQFPLARFRHWYLFLKQREKLLIFLM